VELTAEEKGFVAKRAKFVRAWPLVGTILLLLLLGLGVWLVVFNPLLANPFSVMSELNSYSIPESTLILMAGLLPVVVLTSLILTGAIVLFGFAAFANERKYIALIQRMTGHPGTQK
jgi:hypothetical protein